MLRIPTVKGFSETNDCLPTLLARAVCLIKATFTPSATTTQFGTLAISDDENSSPQMVGLFRTGETPQ